MKKSYLRLTTIQILWMIFYILVSLYFLGFTVFNAVIMVLIYLFSLCFCVTKLGHKLLRFINGARDLETKREKEYLMPLFQEVYERAKQCDKYIGKEINIYMIDTMNINAMALGYYTIAVTRGAVIALSEEELKGFIAHELGHISDNSATMPLITTIGNGIFTIAIIIVKFIMNIITAGANALERTGFLGYILLLAKSLLETTIFIIMYIGDCILAMNSRSSEFYADKFAYKIGYGEELKDALYLLQDMVISNNKKKLTEKLKESHPIIAKRIGRLERLIDGENVD